MENSAAKELKTQDLGAGSVTGDEAWIAHKDLVTNNALKAIIKLKGKAMHIVNTETKEILYVDMSALEGYVSNKSDHFLGYFRQESGKGMNSFYLYRTSPMFEGQEACEHKMAKDSDNTELYVYARIISVHGVRGTTNYTIFSVVKDADPDAVESGLGFLWRDVYKVVKVPQFQYSTLVLDMDGNLVCMSYQKSAVDLRPVFEFAPGVDIPSIVDACLPLLPDGSKVMVGMEAAELASWPLSFVLDL